MRLPGNPIAGAVERFGGPKHLELLAKLPAQGSSAWQDGRGGEFAAWTLLGAAARGDSAAWALRRLDALRQEIQAESASAAACPPATAMLARVALHALAIGDIAQMGAGEADGLDPLLRQAAPEPPALQSAAPGAPSSLELVHACLQRWLREAGPGEAVPGIGAVGRGAQAWTVDTPLSDIGIDSLASVPLALDVEQASGVPVSAELLYDYPTVRLLADYIDEHRMPSGAQTESAALSAPNASG